jgi:hypothetical protein
MVFKPRIVGGTQSTEMEEFEAELASNMATLRKNIELLDSDNQNFAMSLCNFYEQRDYLSPKQKTWACKFWQEVNSLGAPQEELSRPLRQEPTAKPEQDTLNINGKKMLEMFDKAAETLKYPSIKYTVDEKGFEGAANTIRFYRAGANSKHPGSVVVTNGLSYGDPDNKVLAHIHRDGRVVFATFMHDKPAGRAKLKEIIEQPVEQFVINGKKYAHCCFCGLELTAGPSIAAGYGPICADKWGLPWGEAVT